MVFYWSGLRYFCASSYSRPIPSEYRYHLQIYMSSLSTYLHVCIITSSQSSPKYYDPPSIYGHSRATVIPLPILLSTLAVSLQVCCYIWTENEERSISLERSQVYWQPLYPYRYTFYFFFTISVWLRLLFFFWLYFYFWNIEVFLINLLLYLHLFVSFWLTDSTTFCQTPLYLNVFLSWPPFYVRRIRSVLHI